MHRDVGMGNARAGLVWADSSCGYNLFWLDNKRYFKKQKKGITKP